MQRSAAIPWGFDRAPQRPVLPELNLPINNNGGSVSAAPLSFLSGYTVTAPRLVRIKSGVDRLMAYSDLDKESTWPSASLSVIDSGEVTNYEVGYHPHVRETATGVVKKQLTSNLYLVSFIGQNDIYLHESEIEDDPRAEAVLSASAVRLRAFMRPAYSIGSLDESEVVGVLRYGLRGSRSPVLGDGTVTLMVANGENGGQCLRMMINELEPAVVRLPWPEMSPFSIGDAVLVRDTMKMVPGEVSTLTSWDRPGIIVGSSRGSLVVNWPDLQMCSGLLASHLEPAWRPSIGMTVRVSVSRPSVQATRRNTLWAHDRCAVGTVVAVTHDGVALVDFEGTPTQCYYLNEIEEVASTEQEESQTTSGVTCPLTLAPFRDPVVCEDGESYERSAWEEYVARENTPYVRSPLQNTRISVNCWPNRALRRYVEMERELREGESRPTEEDSSPMSSES